MNAFEGLRRSVIVILCTGCFGIAVLVAQLAYVRFVGGPSYGLLYAALAVWLLAMGFGIKWISDGLRSAGDPP